MLIVIDVSVCDLPGLIRVLDELTIYYLIPSGRSFLFSISEIGTEIEIEVDIEIEIEIEIE
jgi:hypothetical protein